MSNIEISYEGSVCIIALNRPEKKNAISLAMYQAMSDGINEASENKACKAIVLTGKDVNFTSGNDLADFLSNPSMEGDSPVYQFLLSLLNCQLPLIAAVEGFAIGIGSTLLLHCEQVIASTTAKFSFPFVNLGMVPEAASSLLLSRFVGYQRAAHWLLTGDTFLVDEALQAGLVGQKVAEGEAFSTALNYAKHLAEKPRSSLVATKMLMRRDEEAVADRLHLELEHFIASLSGDAAKEAMTAFMEKRKPDFSNL